jgi:hypothetical protein
VFIDDFFAGFGRPGRDRVPAEADDGSASADDQGDSHGVRE